MTEDIERVFAEHTPQEGPPMSMTVDGVIGGGRRRRVRRRIAAISGTAVVVAVAIVALLAPNALLAASPDHHGTPGGKQSHSVDIHNPLPKLNPDKEYVYRWSHDSKSTQATRRLTAAYWKYIDEHYPDYQILSHRGPGKPTVKPSTSPDRDSVRRTVDNLVNGPCTNDSCDEATSTGYTTPAYHLYPSYEPRYREPNGQPLVFKGDPGVHVLGMVMRPAGSYIADPFSTTDHPRLKKKGTYFSDPHLVAGCDDFTASVDGITTHETFACDSSTGPHREKVLKVKWRTTISDDPNYSGTQTVYEAQVIRADGTALSATATYEPDVGGSYHPPRVSLKDLTELLLSLPQVTVE